MAAITWDMSSLDEVKIESREDVGGAVREERSPEPRDYEMEFFGDHSDDLNVALLIAGLLSAAISAFIISINPQLQLDPFEESAVLLRFLAKNESIVFGDGVSQVPHWISPPSTIVMTQALLYLSLAATLASAFFAILAKQLLNRSAFSGSEDSYIEQGRIPERRLRCSFLSLRFVLSTLSLLLRCALFLFSCAVSVCIWEFNTTIATIVFVVGICAVPLYSPFNV